PSTPSPHSFPTRRSSDLDPFWRIQTLVILMIVGLSLLVFWELRSKSPIIEFRVLRDRNLAMSCIILFSAFAVLYAASISLPAMLDRKSTRLNSSHRTISY